MIRKTFQKLVYGLKTKWHESGKRQELLAVDHRVDLLRGGEGPPLVFLHGFLGETRWLPFHQQLAERFDVIAPAHPGYGETEGLDGVDTMEDVVFHYLDVLDGLGLSRAHVVGVSLGGWIAAELAVRHPERISRLVLADAFGLWLDEHPIPDFFAKLADTAALRRLLFADPSGPMADLLLPTKAPDADRMVAAFKAMEATARLGWNPFMHDPKLAGRLRRVSCPTLLVWGERDALLPLAYAEAYRDGIPNAELEVIPDSGHLPHFEQEARFVKAVTEFLSRK
jgi:pimeloyl-ACP methyl ester carboxylesterase